MADLGYTCNTCLVAFRSSDAQRDHMRRDWHLYNVKRRIVSLPPVAQDTFNEKVLAAKATTTAAAAKASFEKTCDACQKSFYSENSYQNHIKSSKHKTRAAKVRKEHSSETASVMSSTFSLGEPINKPRDGETDVSKVTDNLKNATITEEDEQDEQNEKDEEMAGTEAYSATHCLFCNHEASDIHSNAEHMLKSHGMFIPEKDFLVDIDGLIHYLYRKVENSECIYCHTIRNTPEGARAHMRDKSHCMIAFETEDEQIEIGQYYDFRSTYSDGEDDNESTMSETPDNGGVKVSDGDEGGDGWETETSASSVDEEEYDNSKAPAIYQTEYELHLPSGRAVGHRSLARYFRQNLHNYPSVQERVERQLAIANGEIEDDQKPKARNANRAMISRANGGTGMIGTTDSQKQAVVTSERKERDRATRSELRYQARINRAANHQKHFRDPLLQ